MRIIKASTEIISSTPNLERVIELAGRTCYKSEDKITEESASGFIEKVKSFKHESTLEHGAITVRFIVDRGVSHELVRHRLASFSQESTRYCNYGKDKFGNEITVIRPCWFPIITEESQPKTKELEAEGLWIASCHYAEQHYFELLSLGWTPQQARSVLPNSLKTEVVMTCNPREWRHVFKVRAHRDAHPQMVEVMKPLLAEFQERWPALFGDVNP